MRNITLLAVSLLIVTGAAAAVAVFPQDSQDGDQTGREPVQSLSWLTERKVKQDFFNLYAVGVPRVTMHDVEIYKYYGTYNGCVVLDICCDYLGRITLYSYEMEGFVVPGLAIAWKSGHFYNLPEAYDLGLLTKGDLSEISRISFS